MKTMLASFAAVLRLARDGRLRGHRFLARLLRDEEGAWLIYMTFLLPVLIGVAGLGTEGGMLFYQHRSLQSAADAAAYSAAIACSYSTNPSTCAGVNITTQAQAAVASYGFALGTGTGQANVAATAITFATLPAVHVTISRPQTRNLFEPLPFDPSKLGQRHRSRQRRQQQQPVGDLRLGARQQPKLGKE